MKCAYAIFHYDSTVMYVVELLTGKFSYQDLTEEFKLFSCDEWVTITKEKLTDQLKFPKKLLRPCELDIINHQWRLNSIYKVISLLKYIPISDKYWDTVYTNYMLQQLEQ